MERSAVDEAKHNLDTLTKQHRSVLRFGKETQHVTIIIIAVNGINSVFMTAMLEESLQTIKDVCPKMFFFSPKEKFYMLKFETKRILSYLMHFNTFWVLDLSKTLPNAEINNEKSPCSSVVSTSDM